MRGKAINVSGVGSFVFFFFSLSVICSNPYERHHAKNIGTVTDRHDF